MKKFLAVLAISLAFAGAVDAKPGGGGGGGGGHSSVSSGGSKGSFSAPSAAPRPVAPPTANKGSFSAPPPSQRTTTTTTTTVNRTYSSRYVSGGGMYGGWGMGYHYNNGLMTGLIIGSMMHPYGTVMYAGPGMYSNNAVLYPDGRVVNQQGYQVGNYVNGQFVPVQNGAMVAQAVPADAGAQPVQQQVVYVEKPGPSAGEIALMILLGIGCLFLFLFIVGVL